MSAANPTNRRPSKFHRLLLSLSASSQATPAERANNARQIKRMICSSCSIWINTTLALSAFLWAMVLHELGHWLYFRWVLHKKVVISLREITGSGIHLMVGCPADYKRYSATQKLGIYLSGIAAGAIPLILLTIHCWPYAILIWFYINVGCWPDIKNIKRLYK